ncbi:MULTISPECIES: KTSC domain-containing protein [Paenibacillus]|uniref:KTSC domain-containing protein n=1 Tax=Paenibacillus radicis (ex Xue et al. 2023) TaxID=2972489 RepID=A0ABT1YHD5_9BACL|nr:KTSC domain-containing protein [Paenibacillus radicis (ex Xue et al. 2023)]MCR8632597.1 KTSC domain-containing protein [Paenibacillus radicis (ex Xue et al. 2023)]
MKYIPISSKQIAYVSYDDQSSQMHIQYHTGHSHICDNIDQEQVQQLIQSDNPYDLVMRLTQLQRVPNIQTT